MNSKQFTGHKLLVVGGTSGIGLQTAKGVAEQGGAVVVIGRHAAKAEAARNELVAIAGAGKATALVADLSTQEGVHELMTVLDRDHVDIDLLVNAAGVLYPKPFLEHSVSDYDQYLNLNRAFFFITQKVVSLMIAQSKGGAIVNVGSMCRWGSPPLQGTRSSP